MKKADALAQWVSMSPLERSITTAMYGVEEDVTTERRFAGAPPRHGPKSPRWAAFAANRGGTTWALWRLVGAAERIEPETKRTNGQWLKRFKKPMERLEKTGLLETTRMAMGHHFGGRKVLWARLTKDGRSVVRAGGNIIPKQKLGLKKGEWFLLQRLCELGDRDLSRYPYGPHPQLIKKGLATERRVPVKNPDRWRAKYTMWAAVSEKGRRKYKAVREELEALWGRASGVD